MYHLVILVTFPGHRHGFILKFIFFELRLSVLFFFFKLCPDNNGHPLQTFPCACVWCFSGVACDYTISSGLYLKTNLHRNGSHVIKEIKPEWSKLCCKGQVSCCRKSWPPPSPASVSQPPHCQQQIAPHRERKCPPSAKSASWSPWGPLASGSCPNSDFLLFSAVLASSLQMAFVWETQGAPVPGPSPRAKSRLRFSKSYRYCSLLSLAVRFFDQHLYLSQPCK